MTLYITLFGLGLGAWTMEEKEEQTCQDTSSQHSSFTQNTQEGQQSKNPADIAYIRDTALAQAFSGRKLDINDIKVKYCKKGDILSDITLQAEYMHDRIKSDVMVTCDQSMYGVWIKDYVLYYFDTQKGKCYSANALTEGDEISSLVRTLSILYEQGDTADLYYNHTLTSQQNYSNNVYAWAILSQVREHTMFKIRLYDSLFDFPNNILHMKKNLDSQDPKFRNPMDDIIQHNPGKGFIMVDTNEVMVYPKTFEDFLVFCAQSKMSVQLRFAPKRFYCSPYSNFLGQIANILTFMEYVVANNPIVKHRPQTIASVLFYIPSIFDKNNNFKAEIFDKINICMLSSIMNKQKYYIKQEGFRLGFYCDKDLGEKIMLTAPIQRLSELYTMEHTSNPVSIVMMHVKKQKNLLYALKKYKSFPYKDMYRKEIQVEMLALLKKINRLKK